MASTAELEAEILADLEENPNAYTAPVNDVITIDPETKTINLPSSEVLFGTEEEHGVERKYFKCPRIVGDNIDLFTHQIYISYMAVKDKNATFIPNSIPQSYWCDDVALDETGNYITFSWLLSGNVLASRGFVGFAVIAKSVEGDILKTRWKTAPAVGTVLMTLPDAGEGIAELYPDIIAQLLDRMDAVEEIATVEAMQGYVDDYLGRNPVQLDSTLTDPEKAAPADVVGELRGDLNELKEQGIGGGSGIPQAQKTNLAKAIRQELAFASTSHPFIDAFLAWLESGSDTPPEDKPTAPTLTGITVTWSAESADVGTDPKTLITSVKAVYSDGSQQTATGYSVTPSALVEGDNNVVVSYDGMSETKSITGIVPEVDVIVYRPVEDCPDGWNVVTIDGDTDISIPIFNNNPSGENGVTFAEVNITDICSYGNTSVNNIKMPSQFTFNNNLNDVNLKGVSNVCCAVFWQNKRYLQFGLSSSDCGTTVESIKQYLARYNYVFYVR